MQQNLASAPRIRAARAWTGKSRAQFALVIGTTASTLARWERQGAPAYTPTLTHLIKILEEIEQNYEHQRTAGEQP